MKVQTLQDLAKLVDYSLMNTLNCDPDATEDGVDHSPREVFSGHFVPVKPTPIKNPKYIAHSKTLFNELGFSDSLAESDEFIHMFSGDLSQLPEPMSKLGWACGYALSIYATEYYQQCPFNTGNGYGDGRAMSVLEALLNGKRWEMQLKGGGQTPYCRGADGRAVLRSSVREFLAQEHMHALRIPTSRSLSLYTSNEEKVQRPWYRENSYSKDPEVMIEEAVAITTRVAPSFIRVGQVELFGRRARKNEHPNAMQELEMIVLHLIDREYSDAIDKNLTLAEKVLLLASEFRARLTSLVANWIRIGYCQGNFNSDNCAAGGFTLDYGPFGFIDVFDPEYQPWTGGGKHFSFFNQPNAAEKNFHVFCMALSPLLSSNKDSLEKLNEIRVDFSKVMQVEMQKMWSAKLGLITFDGGLFKELKGLMLETSVDYTIFFRELSSLPQDIEALKKSFYKKQLSEATLKSWSTWLKMWNILIDVNDSESKEELSKKMKLVNPKYSLREWYLVPAYQQATQGNYTLIREMQEIMIDPYAEQSKEIQEKYYRLKPTEFFEVAGISHISCSS
ncbi:YdiU family protein [Sulfurimonas sp. SAG-AH-194-C21]|nr:protein adenylyltransferase SelO family protein [Sulfurimonas sp. SAG-AH-194-C21]MDF1884090.1 YdiU family protein [Sulfurimonas sp. SAG-AH-194-C21]